ncbi:hypothetical protein ACTFIY_009855 [Dictyostelium cf. discoideum]
MNKILIQILLLIVICFITSFGGITNADDSVTLIVNPNINNNGYQPGDKCGNSTEFTCNNLSDAVNYFKTIATVQNNIYQLLNIKLSDSIYNASESYANFYQYNVTISPLDNASSGVIFSGVDSNSPLFTITPPPPPPPAFVKSQITISVITPQAQAVVYSQITISGITFKDFSQTILQVATDSPYTSITFDACNFQDFDSSKTSNHSMIDINSKLTQPTQNNNISSSFSMTDCSINGANSGNSELIITVNTNNYIENLQGNAINALLAFYSESGSLFVSDSNFSNCTTIEGILYSSDSSLGLSSSTFQNNNATLTSAVVTYSVSIQSAKQFQINNCQFINNNGLKGWVILLLGSVDFISATGNIVNNVFNGNSTVGDGDVGVIYTYSIPVLIVNNTFSNNYAGGGDGGAIIYANHSNTQMTNCNITTSSNIVLFYLYYSTSYFTNVNFGNTPNAFVCDSSNIYFSQEPTNLDPSTSVTCKNCTGTLLDKNQDFCPVPTTSTTSTTTTGSATFIKISKLFIILSIVISIILI